MNININTDNLYDPSYNETALDRITEDMTDEETQDYFDNFDDSEDYNNQD
jgi:hypothetical protein